MEQKNMKLDTDLKELQKKH